MDAIKRWNQRLKPALITLLIGVVTYVALFLMLAATVAPDQYDLRVGQVSPITITASRDVEDTVATQQLIDEMTAAVQPPYISDNDVQQEVLTNLNNDFARLEAVNAWELDGTQPVGEVLLGQAQSALTPLEVDEEMLSWLLGLPAEKLQQLKDTVLEQVDALLTDKLAEGREEEAISKIQRTLIADDFDEQSAKLVGNMLQNDLKPNLLIDEEAYEAKKAEAAAAVEPIIYLKGRNIVRSGEIVTRAQIMMLDSLGMLKNRSLDIAMLLGLGLLLLLLMLVVVIYMWIFEKDILADVRKVALLGTIFLITTGVCIFCQELSIYLMPVTLGVMLTTQLLKDRLALIVNIALAVLCGLTASGASSVFSSSMFAVMLTSIVSGTLCIAIMRQKMQRVGILLAGLGASAFNIVTAFAVNCISSVGSLPGLSWLGWSAGGGMLAAVLCIGLQPALEWAFNLVTSAKLLELSNPNRPLIRRLILEASGTYHHSIIVANLAEAAADAIGANGLLARVGAYYHDVGKLKRPLYFKENQIGDNPHDRTDPMVSAAILISHPRDGVALAQKQRMPKPILDIIEQHHGDTAVVYFYDRYVKLYGDQNVNPDDFRYPGPKPQTVEAAIVMLADTVEAAARALPNPNMEKMDQLIRKLVRAKVDDGQLNDSPLTMRDLDRICQAFLTVLSGVFHQRVEYPTINVPRKGSGAQAKAAPSDAEAEKKPVPELSAPGATDNKKAEEASSAQPKEGTA